MDHLTRLPVDCPRCESRGVIDLDDDVTHPCALCNSWGALCLSSSVCCAACTLMMRRSPSVSGPTRHYESSGQAPSGTMAAFGAWLKVRGHGTGALFGRAVRGGRGGERRLADEGVAVIL